MSTHADYAAGLRLMADFIEAHPEIPVPLDVVASTFIHTEKDKQKKAAARIAKLLGYVNKGFYDASVYFTRQFSKGVGYQVWFDRDAVCERVVTGTKLIPAREERIVPAEAARSEDIVEWHCHSILSGGAE